MTQQDKDILESAIWHIETSVDVDGWAVRIAKEAIGKQIPKKPNDVPDDSPLHKKHCPQCGRQLVVYDWKRPFCMGCGQRIDWSDEK